MENGTEKKSEIDWLIYKGNAIPAVIKFAWISIILFTLVYTILYAWPDLKIWLAK